MTGFISPFPSGTLSGWDFSVEQVTLPPGLRYSGYTIRGLRCVRPAGASPLETNVRLPAAGILHQVDVPTGQGGGQLIELQTNPFLIRSEAQALVGGIPTFYFWFDPGQSTLSIGENNVGAQDDLLGEFSALTFVVMNQDLMVLDPALLLSRISSVLDPPGIGTWPEFVNEVTAQTASGATAPVLLLGAAGRPIETGQIDVIVGVSVQQSVDLVPADGGDLQKALVRLGEDPMWGSSPPLDSVRLRPVVRTNEDPDRVNPSPAFGPRWQLVRLEDGLTGEGEIEVTPTARHVSMTDLHEWFAPQYAIPTGATEPALARYHRGSKLTPFGHGIEYYQDLVDELNAACVNGPDQTPGFQWIGLTLDAEMELAEANGEDPGYANTVQDIARRIGKSGGGSRFLPSSFFQMHGSDPVQMGVQATVFLLLVGILYLLRNVKSLRTDGSGFVVMTIIWVIMLLKRVTIEDAEPNKDAVELLGEINSEDDLSGTTFVELPHHPSLPEDNPLADGGGIVLGTVFSMVESVGFFHQKIALVRSGSNLVSYTGGIDLWPDRLDDERHTAKHTAHGLPFFDIQTKVEGPAMRDLLTTFEQRWAANGTPVDTSNTDGAKQPLAFTNADVDTPPTSHPRPDIVQVGRTFPRVADNRAFDFAPQGDRTLASTLVRAIKQAKEGIYIADQYFTPPSEFRKALLDKVTNREIKTLTIMHPGVNDQLFGDIARGSFTAELMAADAGVGIVQVSTPRRRITVAQTELRSSSGKLLLDEVLPNTTSITGAETIALGPIDRLPAVPFWVAIEGELIWVYQESQASNTAPDRRKLYLCDRGVDTHIVSGEENDPRGGTTTRAHAKGAPAMVVDLANIYIHAKVTIVDDVFLSIGSSNLNRRGFYHDVETNVFSLPHHLRYDPKNPVAQLRQRIWAHMTDIPLSLSAPLMRDPVAASQLLRRSYFEGNRFVPYNTMPAHYMYDTAGSDGVLALVLRDLLGMTTIAFTHDELFDGVIDPTTDLENEEEVSS